MVDSIEKWEVYAKQTPYNWDNMVVSALHSILCISDEAIVPQPPDPIPEPVKLGPGGA